MLASRILVASTDYMAKGYSRRAAVAAAFHFEIMFNGTDKGTLRDLWALLVGGPVPQSLA